MGKGRRVRAVCFDFQDTLARFVQSHYGLYVEAARMFGVEVDEAAFDAPLDDAWAPWRTPEGIDHSAISVDEATFRVARREVHRARFLTAGIDSARLDEIVALLDELESQPVHYELFEDALPALEALRERGIRAVIVSNHIWGLPEVADALGLTPLVATVITSARAGYRKPHPAIYRRAIEASGVQPSDVLFVGDSREADVEGPRRMGMRGVLLDRDGGGAADGIDGIRSLRELPLE